METLSADGYHAMFANDVLRVLAFGQICLNVFWTAERLPSTTATQQVTPPFEDAILQIVSKTDGLPELALEPLVTEVVFPGC